MTEKLTYQQAGVDTKKAEKLIQEFSSGSKTSHPDLVGGLGAFAAAFRLSPSLKGLEDPVLLTCCDGVGTKLKLALDWNTVEGLGQDLVAMSVNDLLCSGGRPLLFLDYYACGKLAPELWSPVVKSIQAACEASDCLLVGGETAEMPGLYANDDFDLAGFAVGVGDRPTLLGPNRVESGDTLIAISSNGPHSNGFSLIRKLVERENLKPDETTSFSDETWAEVLLKPTSLYVKQMVPLLPKLHSLCHVTGGGLYENLPRVLPKTMKAEVSEWSLPPLFEWLSEKAALDRTELLSTFNAGIGLIAIASQSESTSLMKEIENTGLNCWKLGQVSEKQAEEPSIVWT